MQPSSGKVAGGRTSNRNTELALPGIILGVGLGGFADGILLHQLLQWHHLLSSTDTDNAGIDHYPADSVHGLQMNTVWDGVFHTFTWVCVLVGIGLLYARVTRSRGRIWATRALWGWMLLGWGMFNVVEGVIDHHILGIHHVRSGEFQTPWDIGFLVFGALLVIIGWLVRRGAAPLDVCDSDDRGRP